MGLCNTPKKKVTVGVTLGLSVLALGLIMIPVLKVIIHEKVKQNVVLKEGGLVYKLWENMTVPIYMQFYLFHITNVEEMKMGEKPFLEQRGPYTYSEERFKVNITRNDNGTLSYRQIRIFRFVREMSSGDDSDKITTLNPPMLTLINAMRFQSQALKDIIGEALALNIADLFMSRSVKETLFGYTDPLLEAAHLIDPDWFTTAFVGFFTNKNNTDDGLYTVYSGENNIADVGVVTRFNGEPRLNYWTTPWSNMLNGTDGTISPPFIEGDVPMRTFVSDICRSAYGIHTGDVKTINGGIPARRYTGVAGELASADDNPDNIGFCTPQTNCLKGGVLNISTCQMIDSFHVPAMVSFPHFYLADKSFLEAVGGLHPNKEEHQTAVDIEPLTGIVLQASKRVQMNMYLAPVHGIKQTTNLKTVVLPIYWVNESSYIDDVHANMIRSMVLTPLLLANILMYGMIGGGSLTLLSAVAFGCYIKRRKEDVEDQCTAKQQTDKDETKPLLTTDSPSNNIGNCNSVQNGTT